MENHPATPDCILAGLGVLERKELAGMIALIENARFLALTEETARKAGSKLKLPFFERRKLEDKISAAATEIEESADKTSLLRHRLWCRIQDGFGIDSSLPFSTPTARRESVKLGHEVSRKLSSSYSFLHKDATRSERMLDWVKRKAPFFWSQENLEFGKIVELEVVRLLGVLLKEDVLDEETKSRLTDEIRNKFDDIPTGLKDQKLRDAISSGDWKIVGTFLAGSTVGGVALAVELAGFSAYILAAQASAIIPLVGGQTTVSLLAILAAPASFVLTVVGGWFVVSRVTSSVKFALATRITILLALKGVMNRENGFISLLDDFRRTDLFIPSARKYLSEKQCWIMSVRRKRVEELAGNAISSVPGPPPSPWGRFPEEKEAEAVEKFLSSDRQQKHNRFDVLATGALTAGDFLYTIWSIDPMVIRAADFSRTAEIGNVFEFAAFAERWKGMSAAGAQAFENSLRGYTAEQLVLMRLVEDGHAVELAGTSNTPGFDVIVDGEPFQIKCGEGENISLLAEHFEKHESIPVIANAELAKSAEGQPWAEQVFAIEGFDLETVKDMTSAALDAGVEIDDLPVPFYAAIVGAARNLQNLREGRMGLSDLPGEIAVDVAIRGTLAVVGANAGTVAGLILFGPAGVVILPYVGGVASLRFVPKVRGAADKVILRNWSEEVVSLAVSLKKDALCALDRRIERLKRDFEASYDPDTIENWLYARKLDDIIASTEQRVDIENQNLDTPLDGSALLSKVVAAHLLDQSIRKKQTELIRKLQDKPRFGKILRKRPEKGAEWVKEKVSSIHRKRKTRKT